MALNEALVPLPASREARFSVGSDAARAFLAALAFAALYAVRGFPDLLTKGGDNDSLVRLVEVRDWLAGQGWFDLHQYRMGLEGGFMMHWSRLIDLPLGALVLLGSLVGGSREAGELFAQFAWPMLMVAGCVFALVKISRLLWGEAAVFPAAVLGIAALYFTCVFSIGNIDHHSAQLLLTLCAAALLMRAEQSPVAGGVASAIAGACAGVMLGIGVETTAYVAVAALFVSVRFALDGQAARAKAAGFGLGLGATAALVFFATVAPESWSKPVCDAFSAPQALLAVAGGFGLAAIAGASPLLGTRPMRLLALFLLGIACAALCLILFPQCLGDPYAGFDPRLKTFWLDRIAEAQPITRLVQDRPAQAAGFYVTPLLAGALLAWKMLKGRVDSRIVLPLALVFAAALAISLWQVRGGFFAVPLAVPVLAGLVAERRQARAGVRGAGAALALCWLVSIPIVWAALAVLLIPDSAVEAAEAIKPAGVDFTCEKKPTFAALAALPPANVFAVSNLGALILADTHHHVFAGSYHRNAAANLAVLDAWMSDPRTAQARLGVLKADIVAFCPGSTETRSLARAAPLSLIGEMQAGRIPSWLQPVAGTQDASLQLFRVTH